MSIQLVDAVLLVALVLTSIRVGTMYRELKRLRAYHDEYRQIFEQTGEALGAVEKAVAQLHESGRETLVTLSERIEEARALTNVLDASLRKATAPRLSGDGSSVARAAPFGSLASASSS